jgi:hypothetical protein
MIGYTDQNLTFDSSKIHFFNPTLNIEEQVMMEWEDPLMAESAKYVCQNGGDILEIGFGMGISAGYIQSYSINTHTIIENHPEVILRAQKWALDKPNVTIINQSWYKALNNLSTYDGLFYDTFNDDDMTYFSSSLSQLIKPGGVATWWNSIPEENNFYNIPNVTYKQIPIEPPPNSYFNSSTYYLPQCQL